MKSGYFINRMLLTILPALLWAGLSTAAYAQAQTVISGRVVDAGDHQPIPYAHVALFDSTQTHLQTGVVTDTTGYFHLTTTRRKPGVIHISTLGYETAVRTVQPAGRAQIALGEIALQHTLLNHEEVWVLGEQVRARSGTDRTTYFVNENLQNVTTSGTDVLRFIPGVQVDLMQNISLQGSREILILVDGQERSPDVMSRINAADIERVEVMDSPPSRYDANVTGVINLVLKEKAGPHLSGHVHLEAPGSADDVYLFPAYSLQYGSGKFNLFTSYNGAFSYFNIEEVSARTLSDGPEVLTWNTTQFVRQKNWSHKFYYGADYWAGDKHVLSFYGWLNPFSGEMNGDISSQHPGDVPSYSERQENDSNLATFHSLHYTFTPGPSAGHELSVEAGLHTLHSDNHMTFSNGEAEGRQRHLTKPSRQIYQLKTDYNFPLNRRLEAGTGVHFRHQSILNSALDDFKYTDESGAAYGMLNYRSAALDVQAGLRAERYRYGMRGDMSRALIGLFPSAAANYTWPENAQSLKLSYRRSVRYPYLYQLNPGQFFEDPYAYRTGNPRIDPAFIHDVNLEYSRIFGNSHISATLFYRRTSDAIHSLTSVTEEKLFETNSYNLGTTYRYGARFSGNLEVGRRAGIQPYLSLFSIHTSPYALARGRGISSRRSFAWEAGISAYMGFGDGFTLSGILDYASPLPSIQQVDFKDALYFISVGKSVGRGGKAEIATGLPFSKSFTYRGYEIDAPAFTTRSEGIIKLNSMPLMFKFTWRFSKGEQRNRIGHDEITTPGMPGKGF